MQTSALHEESKRPYDGTANHSTAGFRRLVEPWQETKSNVCADSYIASAQYAVTPLKLGVHFTGLVNTETRGFPMKLLRERKLTGRGQKINMICDVDCGHGELLALVSVDRNRRYFRSPTCCTTRGVPYSRYHWRQTVSGPAERTSK